MPDEETDLSFADFGGTKRQYTAPTPITAVGRSRKSAKRVVTRARFERATPSFGGWCSIQLSYRATRGLARNPNSKHGGTYWIRTSDLCGVNTAL